MQGSGLVGLAPNKLDGESKLFMDSMGFTKFSVNYPAKRVNFDQVDSDFSGSPLGKHQVKRIVSAKCPLPDG